MITSLQKKLFNYIDEHLTLYLNELKHSIETFRHILDLPVVSTTTGFSELDEDTRKRVFAASIKQLATIFEEMNGNAINTTA